jgi:sugar/nucleoside kinase (ribokinase family)
MSYDVFGMCNALYDLQAEVPEEVLQELNFQKGGMFLIEEEQQRELAAKVYNHIVNAEPGGSGANTAIGVALLGGKSCYTGKVADDEHGTLYAEGLRRKQVGYETPVGKGVTGISVILITPDTQRTMCTFLGMSRSLGPDDIALDALRASKYLYVTGYLWDTDSQKAAVLKAMREARAAGGKVALSQSDPFCVRRHKADFQQIVQEHVDLLFGNMEEAQVFTDTDNPYDAIRAMAPYCDLAAVTMDARGSLLREGDRLHEIPCYPVQAVDTTGAGDMYAAGLLYGLTQGLPMETTGRLASYVAAQVVAKLGPRLEALDQEAVARICAGAWPV